MAAQQTIIPHSWIRLWQLYDRLIWYCKSFILLRTGLVDKYEDTKLVDWAANAKAMSRPETMSQEHCKD
jgi:hypothetical protein